jgi:hypothetical protein
MCPAEASDAAAHSAATGSTFTLTGSFLPRAAPLLEPPEATPQCVNLAAHAMHAMRDLQPPNAFGNHQAMPQMHVLEACTAVRRGAQMQDSSATEAQQTKSRSFSGVAHEATPGVTGVAVGATSPHARRATQRALALAQQPQSANSVKGAAQIAVCSKGSHDSAGQVSGSGSSFTLGAGRGADRSPEFDTTHGSETADSPLQVNVPRLNKSASYTERNPPLQVWDV